MRRKRDPLQFVAAEHPGFPGLGVREALQKQREYGVLLGLGKRTNRLQEQADCTFVLGVLIRYLSDIADDTESKPRVWRASVRSETGRPRSGANRLKV
jgi:hypothetical protein